MSFLSIVICTYSRAATLDELLETVARLTLDPSQHEILVVDNGSRDHTSQVVQKWSLQMPSIKYVYEGKVGLSNARNRGWQEARGIYVGYLDDDCRVPPEWLECAHHIGKTVAPCAFGGPYYGFFAYGKPRWFKAEYASHFQGAVARPLNRDESLSGANMFIRRDLLQQLGGFSSDLGMKGTKIGIGEETLFLRKLRDTKGSEIYYDPKLYVYHVVMEQRMKFMPIVKRRLNEGRASFMIYDNETEGWTRWRIFRRIFWIARQFTKDATLHVIRRDKHKYPYVRNYLYERAFAWIPQFSCELERLQAIKTVAKNARSEKKISGPTLQGRVPDNIRR